VIAVAVVVVLVLLFLQQCSETRNAKTAAAVSNGQAAAKGESGHDAVNTIGNTMAGETAIDAKGDDNARAIDAAPGAAQKLDPALNRAARAGVCRYAAYRRKP